MQRNIVSIHQPNFFPWTGYFNKIKNSDCFIFFDDVQFERGKTYTSRTKVLCQGDCKWLTAPVIGKGEMLQINKVLCDNSKQWQHKHLSALMNYYKKSSCYNVIFPLLEEIYHAETTTIADFNINAITTLLNYLEISTKCIRSSELTPHSTKHGLDKIIELLVETKATDYLSGSGSGSKRYIDKTILDQSKINLLWQEYDAPKYVQLHTESFIPNLSIIDLLFSRGKDTIVYL